GAGDQYIGSSTANNIAPIITTASGTTISGNLSRSISLSSYVTASDADGICAYWFSDSTPGQGYLTLDGQRIIGDSVAVSASDLYRVGYYCGDTLGTTPSNSIAV